MNFFLRRRLPIASDIERLASTGISPSRGSVMKISNTGGRRAETGHGCFLCLSGLNGSYAVLVRCLRPSRSRQVVGQTDIFSDNPIPIYEKVAPWEMACQSDSDVWRELANTCFQHQGNWKRYIPFYGVREVREITVFVVRLSSRVR